MLNKTEIKFIKLKLLCFREYTYLAEWARLIRRYRGLWCFNKAAQLGEDKEEKRHEII